MDVIPEKHSKEGVDGCCEENAGCFVRSIASGNQASVSVWHGTDALMRSTMELVAGLCSKVHCAEADGSRKHQHCCQRGSEHFQSRLSSRASSGWDRHTNEHSSSEWRRMTISGWRIFGASRTHPVVAAWNACVRQHSARLLTRHALQARV